MKISAVNNGDGTVTVDVDSFRSVVSYAAVLSCLIELGIEETEVWTKAMLLYSETVDSVTGVSSSKYSN